MASVICGKNIVIVGIKDRILYLDENLKFVCEESIIPTIPNSVETKPKCILKNVKIEHCCLSPNQKLLAVATSGNKCLYIYIVDNSTLKLCSTRETSRAASCISFAVDSSEIILSDKSGDCYIYDCIDLSTPGKWIFGHFSMVLQVRFSPDKKYIISCDRDEKIKVTNYPESYEIQSYCLGHTEYVSSIAILPGFSGRNLVSISGDKTIKIWEYEVGKVLHEITLPSPGISLSVKEFKNGVIHISALIFQPNESVYIYEVLECNSIISMKLLHKLNFSSKIITSMYYGEHGFFVSYIQDSNVFVECLDYEKNYIVKSNVNIKNLLSDAIIDDTWIHLEDISSLFKKKFDNVSEYLERKRRRIEKNC